MVGQTLLSPTPLSPAESSPLSGHSPCLCGHQPVPHHLQEG